MKSDLELLTPEPVLSVARRIRDALRHAPDLPSAYLHPWRRRSLRNLAVLKNSHRGERCFILGNGPSLRQTDLTKLRSEYSFGTNRIYLLFPELGFTTTFFVSANNLIIEQCVDEIRALPIPKFLTWRMHRSFPLTPDTSFLYTTWTGPRFARDARGRLWEGATITYVTLQLAFHMGFSQVILIGVDHNFVTKGEANTTVISKGDDPNHFAPNYFARGFRWQLPDLKTSELAYSLARKTYESAGRQVLDATVGGKLTVFPKVDYNSLF